jgi:hypothetical protein
MQEAFAGADADVSRRPTMNHAAQMAGEEKVPVMQQILDNPFLLLFLGITVPTVFYIVWGVMEIISIPIAK